MNPLSFRRTSRRQFIQSTGLAATAFGFPAIVSAKSPGSKLNLAVIGVGGRGGANLASTAKTENVVALCDVNLQNLDRAASKYPKARKYKDFRKLYEKDGDIDAVVVSTTEHTHAFAVLPALKSRKHVYCEKPLTRDVYEARVLTEAAKEAGVATQMGTQIHAGNNYRRVVEKIQSGAIGPVREAHVWVGRAWGWQSQEAAKRNRDIVWSFKTPTEIQKPPASLDWDLWIGPAPYRPFHSVYFPGPKWYRWWDFGNGTMSDLGSHFNDLPFWALKLDAPNTVEAWGPPPHHDIAPASMSAKYSYGKRDGMPPVTLTWHQGENKPSIWKEKGIPQWGSGILFIGDNGMLLSDYGKHVLLPEKDFKDYQSPDPWISPSIGHYAEWLNACKTGAPTTCNFGYAGPLTEANHLGNVAYRSGKKINWDAKSLKIPNAQSAEQYLKRTYRKGWSLV